MYNTVAYNALEYNDVFSGDYTPPTPTATAPSANPIFLQADRDSGLYLGEKPEPGGITLGDDLGGIVIE